MENINFEEIEYWISEYNKSDNDEKKKQILTIIFMTCTPLINSIAYGLARRSSDPIEDIIQVANLGFIKAVKRYKKEYKNLKTYISYSIVGEIKHYLRDKINLVRPPREILELSYRINKLTLEELEKAGSQYNYDIIAKALNTSKEKVIEALEMDRRKTISLNQIQFNNEDSKTTFEDSLSDEKDCLGYSMTEYRIILKKAIDKLPEKLKKIIIGLYFDELSQTDLAKILQTPQSNISRMQKRALKILFETINNTTEK